MVHGWKDKQRKGQTRWKSRVGFERKEEIGNEDILSSLEMERKVGAQLMCANLYHTVLCDQDLSMQEESQRNLFEFLLFVCDLLATQSPTSASWASLAGVISEG